MNIPDPAQVFTKLMKENGLTFSLSAPKIRLMQDGAMLIENPTLVINYAPDKLKELQTQGEQKK